jgi:hypothetical protein
MKGVRFIVCYCIEGILTYMIFFSDNIEFLSVFLHDTGFLFENSLKQFDISNINLSFMSIIFFTTIFHQCITLP